MQKKSSERLTLKLLFTCLSIMASACSTMPDQNNAWFKADQVKNIYFNYQPDGNAFSSLPRRQITQQVISNLSAWGYPVDADNSKKYTHQMMVAVGEKKRGATPSGFSFTAGNSNPRALDFQKADIMPIYCALSLFDDQSQKAELTMEVIADDYLTLDKQAKSSAQTTALLVDDFSTTCFNLLSSLEVPTATFAATETQTTQPGWMPSIRIETVTPAPASTTKSQPKNSTGDNKPDAQPTPLNQQLRKRIIIHNQGSPVIFKFGHERK